MVRQPGLRLQRQATGEHDLTGLGQGYHGPAEGVLRGRHPRGGHCCLSVRGIQPESLALEGVGGQVHSSGSETVEDLLPIDVDTGDTELSEPDKHR